LKSTKIYKYNSVEGYIMDIKIRQPIVTVAGHVDHGKTTILDSIRGTCVAAKEAGMITQKISFTQVPSEHIKEKCGDLLEKFKIKLEIPGFLFIDTPGHAAFTNLRKRGGALADLAVLVVDINEGLMEQTQESIEVLKNSKVPFIVALNKIDRIAGWKQIHEDLRENIESQSEYTKKDFEKKFYNLLGAFNSLGFDSDMFYRISDFSKQLALIPCSGKTCEGLPELMVMLAGLAQKFLKGKLNIGKQGKGTILEIKKEKGFTCIEAILYDGKLKKSDEILIAGFDDVIETKMRGLFEALPFGRGYELRDEVTAASGIRLQLPTTEGLIPGMPFFVKFGDVEKLEKELRKEIAESIKTDKEGIIVKAESLGSLEALIELLRKEGIKISKGGVGNITKGDFVSAVTNLESRPLDAVIVAFNVTSEPEAENEKIKVIESEIIYHIIEKINKWREKRRIEIERKKLEKVTMPCKIKILKNLCFRQSKPCVFGVRIEVGTLKPGVELMNDKGKNIDKVKGIQHESKNVEKAIQSQEIAISIPKVTFGRQVKEDQILYSDINENEFRNLRENKKYLSVQEISLLQEIAQIKRKNKATWGI
jgi:translation initiation factor 5B